MDGVVAEEIISQEELAKLIEGDSSFSVFSDSSWQDPSGIASVHPGNIFQSINIFTTNLDGSKRTELSWRQVQALCWEKYRTFGPINASVNSKADYVAGDGFRVYSDNLQVGRFLFNLVYSRKNRLYSAIIGWIVRMQAEGELFLLLTVSDNGDVTVRVLEPSNIKGEDRICDEGMICHPEDVTKTLFYCHYYTTDKAELIPDVNIMFEPDLVNVAKQNPKFKISKTQRSKAKGSKFKQIGGFRRFILHWKNLTGIFEYLRDTSHLRTVLEALNLYWNAIKWELDHKKAQSSYTIEVRFSDSPAGRLAWAAWKKMSQEDKDKTGLTKPLTPGSRVFTMPGMEIEVHAPQLSKLSGQNQDLLNVAGAGARTPQDLFQGQSVGATHSSLRSSRPPLVQEIRSIDWKLEHFIKFEFLRPCFYAKSILDGFPQTFKKKFVESIEKGKPKFVELDVEPVELVKVSFPRVSFEEFPDRKASAMLGSKHAGLESLKVSHETISDEIGIPDMSQERRKRYLEEEEFGEIKPPLVDAGRPAGKPQEKAPEKGAAK